MLSSCREEFEEAVQKVRGYQEVRLFDVITFPDGCGNFDVVTGRSSYDYKTNFKISALFEQEFERKKTL